MHRAALSHTEIYTGKAFGYTPKFGASKVVVGPETGEACPVSKILNKSGRDDLVGMTQGFNS